MNLELFEQLLKRAMGLDAASIGSSAVERAVRSRMTALGGTDTQEYAVRVQESPKELQELIEAIVVPETWFFRDRESFGALVRLVQEEWGRTPAPRVLRILSAPCATGEEPYSIAIALLEAGLAPDRFQVDAIDISLHALGRARQAVYGKNSFRGADLQFRDRFFSGAGGRWELNDAVRRQVHFHPGNILEGTLLADRARYDVVFCRNLLIYFDRPTQDRATSALDRLLQPDGLLFVGPSETGLLLSHGFELIRIPLAFAFRKPGSRRREHQPVPAMPTRSRAARPAVTRPAPPRPRPVLSERTVFAPTLLAAPPVAAHDPLAETARLANQGHLVEAARLCEGYLAEHPRSAKALYLLGVVRDATGKHSDAAELYRKVLYLEPNHHEALMQMSYLLERQGDVAGAKLLTARARRVATQAKG